MTTTSHDIEKELIEITTQFLAESGGPYRREVKLDASLERQLGIDSLGRAELFQRIEKNFNVTMPDRLLMEAGSLADIAHFLHSAHPKVKRSAHDIKTLISHGERPKVDLSQAHTLLDVLLMYGKHSPEKAHIYFQHEEGHEEIITYGELLASSLRVAKGLRELGLKEGETVAIMQPTTPKFFYTFFGTLLAGGIPVPIYPPFRMHMLEVYAKTEARILSNAEVRVLVTFDQAEVLSRLLKTFVPSLKHVVTADELLQPSALKTIFHAKSNNFAFIQYTSGSTSDPKGVLLTHHNLLSNIRAYGKAINVMPNDVAVSWLPLYHDMGLIGMWLGSLFYGVPLVLLTPFTFLNHPERWLWAIHYHRGTLSGAPNFAYELCVRKITPAMIEGLDLSSWRIAANGAEKVYPRTLEQFAKKFAPYGFKRSALLPVYGLAESTVALAIPPLGQEFKIDKVDRKLFEEDRRALPSQDKQALEFVACGLPMEGHEVRIVDDEGQVLAERNVGNLQFRGPSSMQGYYNNSRATQAIYHDGWWEAGDLAYLADSEVYITGRRKDLIIKAGRNLYPAEIEEIVGNIAGVRQGCVAAFGVLDAQRATEQLVVVAETREISKAKRQEMMASINEEIATTLDIVPDHIVLVTPHTVPKTSSGKLQRAACKTMYLQGRLGQWHMPPWMQVIKLGVQGAGNKIVSGMSLVGKFFYTVYMVLLGSLVFFPAALIVKFVSRETSAKIVKNIAKWLLRLALCPVKIINKENLTQQSPVIFASNHASYIDALVLLSILPAGTRIVAKKELFTTPIIRIFMHKLGYLSVDRMDLSKGLEDAQQITATLKAGHSVLIFPEGTFSYASGLRPFRLGAFKIAVETGVPICPIALQGTRVLLRDDEKVMRPGFIQITVCPSIFPQGEEWQHVTQLRSAVRSRIAKYCGEPSLDFIAAEKVAQ